MLEDGELLERCDEERLDAELAHELEDIDAVLLGELGERLIDDEELEAGTIIEGAVAQAEAVGKAGHHDDVSKLLPFTGRFCAGRIEDALDFASMDIPLGNGEAVPVAWVDAEFLALDGFPACAGIVIILGVKIWSAQVVQDGLDLIALLIGNLESLPVDCVIELGAFPKITAEALDNGVLCRFAFNLQVRLLIIRDGFEDAVEIGNL